MRDSPTRFAVVLSALRHHKRGTSTWARHPARLAQATQLAWLLSIPGCAVGASDSRGEPCPCAGGFICDTSTERCLLESDVRASAPPPARVREDVGLGEEEDAQEPDFAGYDGGADGLDARVNNDDDLLPDAGVQDAGGHHSDGSVADGGGPGDAGLTDAGSSEVASIRYPATSCFSSSLALSQCSRSSDGSETMGWQYTCATGDGVCTFEGDCSTSGCIKDAWIAHDLGEARDISRSRFLSDWWGLKPNNYEIWASDDPSKVPLAGATLVFTGIAKQNPWRCVAGESCADPAVPEACCPNGRDAPQAPPSTTYPKYDTLDFPKHHARYWFLFVRNTYARRAIIMQEIEYWGPEQAAF